MKTFPEALSAMDAFRQMNASFTAPGHLWEALSTWLTTHDQEGPTPVRRFLASFFSGAPIEANSLGLDPVEQAFANHIASLLPYVIFHGNPPPSATTRWVTDCGDDFLANEVDLWGIFRIVNLLLMTAISPEKSVAIVTSVRDEGISILEWIAHYRALGARDIFIYTNDNTDGSDALLEFLARHRVIHLINNSVQTARSIQDKVMEHSLHMLDALRQYQWAFYIDVDEFFVPRIGHKATLTNVLQRVNNNSDRGQTPSSISFHWKWFGSRNQFGRTDGLIIERFVHSIHNKHVKSLVRLRDVASMRRVHIPVLLPSARGVTSDLRPFDLCSVETTPVYDIGQLNHYWNKSFQEFAIKRNRGRISRAKHGETLDFSTFFLWGANGRLGNFDPPSAELVRRTRQALAELLAIPGLAEIVERLENLFRARVDQLDQTLSLQQIYDEQLASSVVR